MDMGRGGGIADVQVQGELCRTEVDPPKIEIEVQRPREKAAHLFLKKLFHKIGLCR